MLKKRLGLAKNVSEKLLALESAIDDALALGCDLTTACAQGRKEANLSATVGQEAIGLTGDTLTALLAARSKIVAAHTAFDKTKNQIGLRTFASGGLWKIAAEVANEPEQESDSVEHNAA